MRSATVYEVLEKIRHGDREIAKVMRAFAWEQSAWMRTTFRVEIMAGVYRAELSEMADEAMRAVDRILYPNVATNESNR